MNATRITLLTLLLFALTHQHGVSAQTPLELFQEDVGQLRSGDLIRGRDGNFYGTTVSPIGHKGPEKGSIFKITPNGTFTKLASFTGKDGASPWGPLLEWDDGCLYGTTRKVRSPLTRLTPLIALKDSKNTRSSNSE